MQMFGWLLNSFDELHSPLRYSRWKIFALAVGVLASVCHAGLKSDIDMIIRAQSPARYSVQVVDGDTGKAIYNHHAEEALIPASNMKIISSAAALHYLGPDYEYVTRVGLVGEVLTVIGAGDPLLGDPETDEALGREPGWVLKDIATRLLALKIKRVAGIVVDSTVFDDERVHPSWLAKDLNKAYAAEVCGLNYYANRLDMRIDNEKGRVRITTEPMTSFLTIRNEIDAIRKGSQGVMALRRIGKPNQIILRGDVRTAQGIELAIEKPAVYFGYLLAEELQRHGVVVEGQLMEVAAGTQEPFQSLVEYRSPLKRVLKRCNKDSFNLAAEALMKTVAAHATEGGRHGSWVIGQRVLSTYLAALKLGEKEYTIDDASGLSPRNRLSAQALTRTLYSLYQSDFWDVYKDTLAIAGVDGTLAKYDYFEKPPYRGNILGKTGYITGVKAFSGICLAGEKTFFFAILVNRPRDNTRNAINRIAMAIVDNAKH